MIDVLENGDKILYRVLYGSFLVIGGIFIFVVLVFLGVSGDGKGLGGFFGCRFIVGSGFGVLFG